MPAWEASYGHLDPLDEDRWQRPVEGLGPRPRVVHGDDNRTEVVAPGQYPGAGIAWLLAEDDDHPGVFWGGTGFYVHERMIVTAGHNLFSRKGGMFGRADRCRVYLDHHSTSIDNPDAVVDGNLFEIAPGWESSGLEVDDYAAMPVPEQAACTLHLGIEPIGDAALEALMQAREAFTITGHPLDVPEVPEEHRKPNGTMWEHAAPLGSKSDDRLFYPIDTTKGQSGAPVCRSFGPDEGWKAVGIHNYGGTAHNYCTRITPEVLAQLQTWFDGFNF